MCVLTLRTLIVHDNGMSLGFRGMHEPLCSRRMCQTVCGLCKLSAHNTKNAPKTMQRRNNEYTLRNSTLLCADMYGFLFPRQCPIQPRLSGLVEEEGWTFECASALVSVITYLPVLGRRRATSTCLSLSRQCK